MVERSNCPLVQWYVGRIVESSDNRMIERSIRRITTCTRLCVYSCAVDLVPIFTTPEPFPIPLIGYGLIAVPGNHHEFIAVYHVSIMDPSQYNGYITDPKRCYGSIIVISWFLGSVADPSKYHGSITDPSRCNGSIVNQSRYHGYHGYQGSITMERSRISCFHRGFI